MYLSILASAIAACLPLVPVCLVAMPAALQLLAQVACNSNLSDTCHHAQHDRRGQCTKLRLCSRQHVLKQPCIGPQGRGISAIVLSVLHVLAYYVGDTIIMAEVRLVWTTNIRLGTKDPCQPIHVLISFITDELFEKLYGIMCC